jgi:hypothetical protein
MSRDETLRVVVFWEGESWIAQCLEYDICAQAPDVDTLRSRLAVALDAEWEAGGNSFSGIEKAPEHFFKKWERCTSRIQPASESDRVEVEMALCA